MRGERAMKIYDIGKMFDFRRNSDENFDRT